MNNITKTFAPVLLLGTLCFAAYARLMGAGEITGIVVQSWYAGERVVFNLNISDQKNDTGPTLGNPNKFVYDGDGKTEISDGDIVKFHYNSDDDDGIIVQRLEFVSNKPGSTGQTSMQSQMIILGGVLFGIILVLGGIIYQNRRRRSF